MSFGRLRRVWAMAACTSCAAASMSRSRLKVSTIVVDPWLDEEVIESMPAMVVNCFSSGVATAEAIVSGSAPASEARTCTVG